MRDGTYDFDGLVDYLRENPHSTARDVAREYLGGTGDTRTYERARASVMLKRLERAGKVVRKRPVGDYNTGKADRWSVTS